MCTHENEEFFRLPVLFFVRTCAQWWLACIRFRLGLLRLYPDWAPREGFLWGCDMWPVWGYLAEGRCGAEITFPICKSRRPWLEVGAVFAIWTMATTGLNSPFPNLCVPPHSPRIDSSHYSRKRGPHFGAFRHLCPCHPCSSPGCGLEGREWVSWSPGTSQGLANAVPRVFLRAALEATGIRPFAKSRQGDAGRL